MHPTDQMSTAVVYNEDFINTSGARYMLGWKGRERKRTVFERLLCRDAEFRHSETNQNRKDEDVCPLRLNSSRALHPR